MVKLNTPMINVVLCKQCNISLIKAPLNVEIGVMVKLNTPMINIVINHVNFVQNSLRQALLYLSSAIILYGNWCPMINVVIRSM